MHRCVGSSCTLTCIRGFFSRSHVGVSSFYPFLVVAFWYLTLYNCHYWFVQLYAPVFYNVESSKASSGKDLATGCVPATHAHSRSGGHPECQPSKPSGRADQPTRCGCNPTSWPLEMPRALPASNTQSVFTVTVHSHSSHHRRAPGFQVCNQSTCISAKQRCSSKPLQRAVL